MFINPADDEVHKGQCRSPRSESTEQTFVPDDQPHFPDEDPDSIYKLDPTELRHHVLEVGKISFKPEDDQTGQSGDEDPPPKAA